MSNWISISITNQYVHAVEIDAKGDRVNVKSFKSIKATEPMLKNDTVDMELLQNLITQATVSMKPKNVYVTAPVATGVSNEYILPYDKKESHMRSMIWANISNNLSPEKYLMDYSIVNVFDEDGGKKCKVVAYLMLKSIVADIHSTITHAGLNPKCFEMPQNAIYKLYKKAMNKNTVLFTNLGNDDVRLHLVNPPDSTITRVTNVSDNSMVLEQGVNPVHAVAADQISKMFQFQSIKQPDKIITRVYLFGDGADDEAQEYLSERNEADISLLNITDSKIQLNGADISRYAYNIGAVM